MKKPKFKDVRVRIATRRDHRREATFQEISAVWADKSNPYRGHVSEQEIIGAYERGEEVRGIASSGSRVIGRVTYDCLLAEAAHVEDGVRRLR